MEWTYAPVIGATAVLSALLIVVWRITYAMADYLLLDFPEMDARRLLRSARSMMRGNKKRYLFLMLRFIPLYLLSILSLGITTAWTASYQRAASAAFYRDMISAAQRRTANAAAYAQE